MMTLPRIRQSHLPAEDGYILVAVMLVLGILILSLSVALPQVIQDIQRDRELETLHRGMQYRRAIQLYYRKFHRYPPNLDALERTDNLRFLRKRYIDPLTRKDDWAPIQFGENKVPTTMAFFGQPVIVAPPQGTGPGIGQSGAPGLNGPTVSNQNPPTGAALSSISPGQGAFGGAGIIGVCLPSEKTSIVVYKKQDRYSLWEFVYDPIQEYGLPPPPAAGPSGGGNLAQSGSGNSNPPAPTTQPPSLPPDSPWGPNGNLPAPPGGGNGGTQTWSPNGNLPSPTPP